MCVLPAGRVCTWDKFLKYDLDDDGNAEPSWDSFSPRSILYRIYDTKHQYNETNVIHFSFNLLRMKGLYMFRASLAHPQEVLHKRHLVYCLRMSVECGTVSQLATDIR